MTIVRLNAMIWKLENSNKRPRVWLLEMMMMMMMMMKREREKSATYAD